MDADRQLQEADALQWTQRFLDDLAVIRSANTVRAYGADLDRWLAFCKSVGVHPFNVGPRTAIEFVKTERERTYGQGKTVGARTLVRRLSAVRLWYSYLALDPDATGARRNPIPAGTTMRLGSGIVSGKPALLRYDRELPDVLSAKEMDCFLNGLTTTKYRDQAIVWLLKDSGLRIGEALALRLGDVNWSKRILKIRVTKNRKERLAPVSVDAIAALSNYVRLERPKALPHDYVFVNLGRRSHGKPLSYQSWAFVCRKTRLAAKTPRVHAHAFRHTFATNMAESGMPLDTLQRVLGHSDMDTVMIYNHVRDGRAYREYQEAMAVQAAAKSLGEEQWERLEP